MAKKKSRRLLVAATAFAATPQGRKLLLQAKEYATRPETKLKAQQLISQFRAQVKRAPGGPTRSYTPTSDPTAPTYGTPTKP